MQAVLFPHIFVWGSCFWFCIPGRFPASRLLCHTPSFTHTIFHIQLCHTPSFTYNFVTHHLSHTTLSHTIFHTQLCHTPSFTTPYFTHNFVTHHLSHPPLSHTIFHIQLCHTPSFTYHIYLHLAWQAWHKLTSTVTWQAWHLWHWAGPGGALGRAWSPVTLRRHFAWQAWHLVTSTFILRGRRGRRGTWWHPPSSCVAGVALGDIHLRFTWHAWHLVTSTFVSRARRGTYGTGLALVARLGAPSRRWRCGGTLRGRRGSWWHPPSSCVAGVALGDIRVALGDIHLVAGVALMALASSGGALGRAWSPVTPWHFAWQVWHLATSTFILRGRRGTWRLHLRFTWQAWHLWHWASAGGALGRAWSPVTPRHFAWQAWHLVTSTFILHGRRGTWWHPPSSCVAGVALGDIHLRFTWQAWHLWHWASSGGGLGRAWSPVTPRNFVWQAWHLGTSTFILRGRRGTYGTGLALVARLGGLSRRWCCGGTLRGRRGTWSHPPSFAWQAWHLVTSTVILRGRRGTWRHPPSSCVAGAALGDIHLRFTWHAWHLWHWASSGGALGRAWSPVTPRNFAWQAWHLATSTFILRGRRGTWRHPPSFHVAGVALMALGWLWWRAWAGLVAGDAAKLCVAGVALGDIHLHLAWQAWHLVSSTKIGIFLRAYPSCNLTRCTRPFRQLPPPPIARHCESASDERMPLERAGTANFTKLWPQRCGGAPMSKASAVATSAGSLPMSTAPAESPSEQRREKTSWQQATGEEMFLSL